MRVLIVEDDIQLGDALSTALRQTGYAADWFRSGEEADAAMAAVNFDALVLDLGLPGGDGMQWLKRWRAAAREVPVLILTARDGVEHRVAGLDAGADDYLVKPITVDELAARLRALMRRSRGGGQSVWRHGELAYDPAARRVQWQGRDVALTNRELMLLEALLAQPLRVMSKAQIQDKLYDWGEELDSNALEVHVHHLRRKIDPCIIRTVRGVGYALGAGTTDGGKAG